MRLLIFAGVGLGMVAGVEATPVTLNLEAVVSSTASDMSSEFGISVSEGDIITGQFTFEPESGEGASFATIQPYAAKLEIGGVAFITPGNSPGVTLGSLNDGTIVTDCQELVCPVLEADELTVRSSISPAFPDLAPEISAGQSAFQLLLWGENSLLDEPRYPSDSTTWNAFDTVRWIQIIIRGNDSGSLTIVADVGDFSHVPEPAAASLVLLATTCLLCVYRER